MNLRAWKKKTTFSLIFSCDNNTKIIFLYVSIIFCDSCRMYAYVILPKFFSSVILARAIKCNILTKHSNRSYTGSIPKLQVTFWSPFNKRFIFNIYFTMTSVSCLMHISLIVKLLLICKWKLVFYIDKRWSIFVYSMEQDYCQRGSVSVGWKIVISFFLMFPSII
jgi:hypothetical protein